MLTFSVFHFGIVYFFLSFTMGFASLLLSLIVYRFTKNEDLRFFIFAMLSFTVLLVSETAIFYIWNMGLSPDALPLLGLLSQAATCLLIFTLPLYAHTLAHPVWRRIGNWIFGLAALAAFAGVVLGRIIPIGDLPYTAMFVVLAMTILYIAVINVSHFIYYLKKPKDKGMRRVNLVVVVLSIVLMPGFFLSEFFYSTFPFIAYVIPRGFFTLPGFYFIWNLFQVIHVGRDLARAPKLDPSLAIPRAALDRFGISDREEDVVRLLVQGLSYKDIADRLFVSLATVKTHTIHIYQKTDARNKVELLHLLLDHPLPEKRG